MNAKQRAVEIYNQHIALATSDGRSFRKTVMDQLMAETGCSLAAAATHYNNAKKQSAPIEGLGRAPTQKSARKPGKGKPQEQLQDDNECFSVLELVHNCVERCQSFLTQGDASEVYDQKMATWPGSTWVLIQGLGPLHGETYKLDAGEKEIKRYEPETPVIRKPRVIEVNDEEIA